MYHTAGINTAIIALHMAERLVYLAQFEPGLFLHTIEKEAIGYVYVVPTMLQAILDYPDFPRRDLSSLKLVGYGASPMPLDLLLRAKRELPTDYANYFGMDKDGYLYLHGRKKDMIIRGGENIYPVEIEAVLEKHPQVAEVAVIGVPDAYWGEIVKAVIVLKPGQKATQEEIIGYCKLHIASYKKPALVEFRTSLPRNAMQKVLKTVLRSEATGK